MYGITAHFVSPCVDWIWIRNLVHTVPSAGKRILARRRQHTGHPASGSSGSTSPYPGRESGWTRDGDLLDDESSVVDWEQQSTRMYAYTSSLFKDWMPENPCKTSNTRNSTKKIHKYFQTMQTTEHKFWSPAGQKKIRKMKKHIYLCNFEMVVVFYFFPPFLNK